MDDSRAVSPNGSLFDAAGGGTFPFHGSFNGGGFGGRHSRQNSYSSHTSRITYNSHAELTRKGGSRELHWRRSGADRESQWGHWLTSWRANNDLPLPTANGGGNGLAALSLTPSPDGAGEAADELPRLAVKTIQGEGVGGPIADRQRLSVQFPVGFFLSPVPDFLSHVACPVPCSLLLVSCPQLPPVPRPLSLVPCPSSPVPRPMYLVPRPSSPIP